MKILYATSIEEGVWRYINLFGKYSSLYKLLKDSAKAKQISFLLKQAEEYYSSAKTSSILTRPVLLYYGMLNLVKALILFKDKSFSAEQGLELRHGIGRGNRKSKSLLTLSCSIGKKDKYVMVNLLKIATSDWFTVSAVIEGNAAKQSQISSYTKQITAAIGKTFRASELFVLIPELQELLLETTNLLPRTIPISAIQFDQIKKDNKLIISNGLLWLRHNKNPKLLKLIKDYESKKEMKDWSLEKDLWDVRRYKLLKQAENVSIPNIRESIFGEKFALFISNKKELSEIVVHYLLAFIYGEVARYNPSIWCKFMETKVFETELIESFFELSVIKFPLLILREFRSDLIYFKQT